MMKRWFGYFCFCLVLFEANAIAQQTTTISTPSDGTYVIASGGRIKGEYILSFEAVNKVQTVHLLVNANQFDPFSRLQIMENHSYLENGIMGNFRFLISPDNSIIYLVMDVGNRGGGTAVSVQYQGAFPYGPSFGGTLAGNEANWGGYGLASVEGNIGIGTINPGVMLDVYAGPVNTAQIRLTSIGADAAMSFNNTGAGGREYWWDSGSAGAGVGAGDFTAWDATAHAARLSISPSGNVGIGSTAPDAKLEVNGNIKLTNGSGASITFADGTVQSTAWTGSLCGGDYAESVDVSGDKAQYEPGDVLVLSDDSSSDVAKSAQPYSTSVAGIYSTKPGLVGRRQKGHKSDLEVPMAMVGIVPTKVSTENGPIKKGDLLVTSSMTGYAMKGTDRSRMLGAIVGKAMGPIDSGTGIIEVLVSLQ